MFYVSKVRRWFLSLDKDEPLMPGEEGEERVIGGRQVTSSEG